MGPAGPVQTITKDMGEGALISGLPSDSTLMSGLPGEGSSQGTVTVQGQIPPASQATGTAKVRYQVPPLTKPMGLKIEMVDATGTRSILSRDVKGGEYISLDAPFVTEGVVTVYLGGEFVWQERYK